MEFPSVPRPSWQRSESANRENGNSLRDALSHAQPKAAPGPRVVMIVDDHARFRCALRNWIAGQHAEYDLIEAGSGEEAVTLAGSREVHVVVMDIELPGINGIEATRRIREMNPVIAVIIVSQHTAQDYVERSRAAGAFAYINKDKVCRELLPAIGHALGSAVDLKVPHG